MRTSRRCRCRQTLSPRRPHGIAPLTVVFSNTSSGGYAESLWDFGDGATSTEENPVHTYAAPGIYTVVLTVRGAGGT